MPTSLVDPLLNGKRRAIARLISHIENEAPPAQQVLTELYPHTGQAHLIGITGAPGTGKSSLVNELAKIYRGKGKTVAIIAVDPTSPFSGGAILGDRIRMRELSGDPGIFIRSMASRGSLGGLARGVHDAIKVFDAAGFDIILIETVGVGQGEVDIARTAHTVLVVEAPGLGDDIQAIKAGILEIADIFVVNKADKPGANKTVSALKTMLELGHTTPRQVAHHGTLISIPMPAPVPDPTPENTWEHPIVKTVALTGEGVASLVDTITQHRQHLAQTGLLTGRNRARLTAELEDRLQHEMLRRLLARTPASTLTEIITKLVNRTLSPYNAVQILLEE